MVEGRSEAVFKDRLAARPNAWRRNVEVVAMDGFSGLDTAVAEEIRQRLRSWTCSTSSVLPLLRSTAADAGFSSSSTVTAAGSATRSTRPDAPSPRATT